MPWWEWLYVIPLVIILPACSLFAGYHAIKHSADDELGEAPPGLGDRILRYIYFKQWKKK